MTEPKVSFIIPYYNAGDTIQETIDSIFSQSYSNFDVWIVNDGSTDDYSIAKLKDFEDNALIKILHQKNAGPSVARNNAIQKCESIYIFPLDADNMLMPFSLDHLLKTIQRTQADAVYGNIQYFGENNSRYFPGHFNIHQMLVFNKIDTCALLKKTVFEKINYDEFLSKLGLEDWEFWLNFYFSGMKASYLNFDVQKMRVHHSSRTFVFANNNIETIKNYIFRKHSRMLNEEYIKLYYQNKQLLESPDYRIGYLLLKPYRLLKSIFNRKG